MLGKEDVFCERRTCGHPEGVSRERRGEVFCSCRPWSECDGDPAGSAGLCCAVPVSPCGGPGCLPLRGPAREEGREGGRGAHNGAGRSRSAQGSEMQIAAAAWGSVQWKGEREEGARERASERGRRKEEREGRRGEERGEARGEPHWRGGSPAQPRRRGGSPPERPLPSSAARPAHAPAYLPVRCEMPDYITLAVLLPIKD